MTSQTLSRPRPSEVARRTEQLLDRYPNLSEQELAELINLFGRLPILEFGLMTADRRLSGKLDAFNREHGRKVRPTLASIAAVTAIPLVIIITVLWWVFG
jgi:hypothetical protein